MSVVSDKLSFVERLEDAGDFSRPQAEALNDAFHQAVSETVAAKQDLEVARTGLKRCINSTRFAVQADVCQLRVAITETKVWSVSVGATITAVLAASECFA